MFVAYNFWYTGVIKTKRFFWNEYSYNFLNKISENMDEGGWHSITLAKLTVI
jgi:hypothetical protein